MSRYNYFGYEEQPEEEEIEQWEESEPVCVKSMIPKANPLMHKVEFTPYEAANYYPGPSTRLPDVLSRHEYHMDRNNMTLIDESVFAHQQLKQDVAHCLNLNKNVQEDSAQLVTLGEFYAHKAAIYEKFMSPHSSNYFATYVLSLSQMGKQEKPLQGLQRNTQTPLITQRSRTERNSLSHRSTVQFNSNFQSGNLFRVYQRQAQEYDLILQNDINTRGNNQWFFFSVRNVPRGHTLRFNIVNLAKKHSLFSVGMRPSVFSMIRFEKRGVGWVREGAKVAYKASSELRKEASRQPYYCLSFEYKFIHEGDIVYFSYSIPYTFTNLTNYLANSLAHHPSRVKLKSLGSTVGGNQVNLFQISSPEVGHRKKAVWIMARQHPGQTTSSFMLQGMLDFLLSGDELAQRLMEQYIFKVVPMLNIDGVVHGNTRAELVGCDSNRQWADPHRHHHPIVHSLKKLIEKDNVEMVLDLHSHSRRLGTFFYANHVPLNSLTRIFPLLVCKNDIRFDWRGNRFGGGSNLTARKVLADLLKVPLVYTVESSFFGYQREGDFKITPYQPNDYREMGMTIFKTFAEMMEKHRTKCVDDKRLLFWREEQLEDEDNLWNKMSGADDVESIGSDEDPAEDQFSKKQLQMVIPKHKKNTKHKKRRFSVKIQEVKPKKEQKVVEEPQVKAKRVIDPQACFKRLITNRCSLSLKRTELKFTKKLYNQAKNAAVQVDIPEKAVLNRSTNINLPLADKMQRKGLCVIGQKVEEELTISGNTVGIQAQMGKVFLKNRNEIALSSENLAKRTHKKSARIGTIMLHNENNFLNRGDVLHSALRMFNKR